MLFEHFVGETLRVMLAMVWCSLTAVAIEVSGQQQKVTSQRL